MEDLLALDGQETRQDTFGQASAENDDLLAHSRCQQLLHRRERSNTRRILHPWLLSKAVEMGERMGRRGGRLQRDGRAAKSHRCTCGRDQIHVSIHAFTITSSD